MSADPPTIRNSCIFNSGPAIATVFLWLQLHICWFNQVHHVVFTTEKKSADQWILTVHTHIVQGLTVLNEQMNTSVFIHFFNTG